MKVGGDAGDAARLARQEGKCAGGVNVTSRHGTRPTVRNALDAGDKPKLDPLSPGPLPGAWPAPPPRPQGLIVEEP
jgi:hypothetical protein